MKLNLTLPLAAKGLLTAAALLALSTSASAHRQWLLPSVTTLSGTDGWVTFDAAISNDLFYPDHFPMGTDDIRVVQPDGTAGKIENAARGRYRSTFDVRIDKPGTWKIGTTSASVNGTFKLNGEDWRVGRRGPPTAALPPHVVATAKDIPAGATDVKLAENLRSNEVFITAGTPTRDVLKPTGKGLEFDPVTHPDDLVADEAAQFRFLIDGKPAAGVKVSVVPGGKRYRQSEGAQELTTGADGVVKVTWPFAGTYWLNATASDDHATAPATTRRMSFTTTLEVPTP